MGIKIILADDHKIVRDGLRTLIQREPDMDFIAEAEDGKSVVELVQQLLPDLVIMDIVMPNMNGVDATREIIRKHPAVKVIALSMHSDKRFVTGMLEAGASGYLLKDCAFDELATAVRAVMSNRTYLSPRITDRVINRHDGLNKNSSSSTVLTVREGEILRFLADGIPSKDIAANLHISVKTVQAHRQNIMRKLNVTSGIDLVKYAVREGLTTIKS
ncbi:MAG TPA: response regulator transcription factor [Deltaproteobacteria bacterium]|nr:response regulator transcription factor [Deltaproteobacteria bacterium]